MTLPDDENHTSLQHFEDRLTELAPVIAALEARRVGELGRSDFPNAKVLWKVMALYQALIRRTLELTGGVSEAWFSTRYLIALTLARSLIETLAVAWDLTSSIEKGVERQDLGAIDRLVTAHAFATRMESWVADGLPKATNILTLLQKIDRDLLQGTPDELKGRTELVLAHYNFLSEHAHPNYLGVTYVFGVADRENDMWRFGQIDPRKRLKICKSLAVALLSVE